MDEVRKGEAVLHHAHGVLLQPVGEDVVHEAEAAVLVHREQPHRGVVEEVGEAAQFLARRLGHFALGGDVGHGPPHMAGHPGQGIGDHPEPAHVAAGLGHGKVLARGGIGGGTRRHAGEAGQSVVVGAEDGGQGRGAALPRLGEGFEGGVGEHRVAGGPGDQPAVDVVQHRGADGAAEAERQPAPAGGLNAAPL